VGCEVREDQRENIFENEIDSPVLVCAGDVFDSGSEREGSDCGQEDDGGGGAASSEHVMQGQGCGSLVGYRCMMNRSSAHLGRARQSRGVHVQAVAGPSCWAGAPLRSPKRTRPALGRWWELCTCTAVEFSSSRPFFAPCKAVEKAENSQDWQLD
jgi:hypothetical protein